MTIGFVPGVTPAKWAGRWRERHPEIPLELMECDAGEQVRVLHDGKIDVGLVRLPIPLEGVHVIPLYSEKPVVVAAKEHFIALYEDEVPLADLEGEMFLDVVELGAAMAVEVAASGAGIAIMPMSLARLYNRRDAVNRPVSDSPETRIGIAWLSNNTSELIEEFIGIVRGRTANSSRQPLAGSATGEPNGKDSSGKGSSKDRRKPTSNPRREGKQSGSSVPRSNSRGTSGGKGRESGQGKHGRRGRR
nr:LysR family substrate-binding domain-containing protein [Arthrobacter roseus]